MLVWGVKVCSCKANTGRKAEFPDLHLICRKCVAKGKCASGVAVVGGVVGVAIMSVSIAFFVAR